MRLNVEFDKEIYEQLSALADGEGRKISHIIRELVIEWIAGKWREKAGLAVSKEKNEVPDVR